MIINTSIIEIDQNSEPEKIKLIKMLGCEYHGYQKEV